MSLEIKVIDVFNTQIGVVGVIEVYGSFQPAQGLHLFTKSNASWKISGIGSNRKRDPGTKYKNSLADSIWDCVFAPEDNVSRLEVGDLLTLERNS